MLYGVSKTNHAFFTRDTPLVRRAQKSTVRAGGRIEIQVEISVLEAKPQSVQSVR